MTYKICAIHPFISSILACTHIPLSSGESVTKALQQYQHLFIIYNKAMYKLTVCVKVKQKIRHKNEAESYTCN